MAGAADGLVLVVPLGVVPIKAQDLWDHVVGHEQAGRGEGDGVVAGHEGRDPVGVAHLLQHPAVRLAVGPALGGDVHVGQSLQPRGRVAPVQHHQEITEAVGRPFAQKLPP